MGVLQTTITLRTAPTGGTRLYPNIVSYQNIKSEDVVDMMCANSGINRVTAYAAAAALRRLIYNYVLNGHTIIVPGLGRMSLGLVTKAVSSLDDVDADMIKGVKVRFSPSKTIKSACKSVKFQGIIVEDDVRKMVVPMKTEQPKP